MIQCTMADQRRLWPPSTACLALALQACLVNTSQQPSQQGERAGAGGQQPIQAPTHLDPEIASLPASSPKPVDPVYRWRMEATTVSGRLQPELIQLEVRRGWDRIRPCVDWGFARNPQLAGRLAVQFMIDRAGDVKLISAVSNTLPDRRVVHCVLDRFRGFSFPRPEAGTVVVVYPMVFEPAPGRALDAKNGLSDQQIRERLNQPNVYFSCPSLRPWGDTEWIQVNLSVSKPGKVAHAEVTDSSFRETQVQQCIAGRIALMDFPATSRPTKATVRLRLVVKMPVP